MRVYPEKLSGTLKSGIAPIYVVSGDEPLLVQESTDLIRGHLRERGYTEREVFHAEGNFDWGQVLFSANSMSLFGDQKILDVRMPSGKPGDKGAKALIGLAEALRDGTSMVLTTSKLDASATRSKWFKALDGAGVHVQIWPLELAQFPQWLERRLRAVGLSAPPDVVGVLAERLEGNLLAAVQEIERRAGNGCRRQSRSRQCSIQCVRVDRRSPWW
jgi:DNA polymerase-3 subunit delta